MSEYHHEYWRSASYGDIYAVQLDLGLAADDQIVGVCGPLPHQLYQTRDASDYEFETNPDSDELRHFRDAATGEEGFRLYEPV